MNKKTLDEQYIINKAISFYGLENQLDKAIEECNELALAILRFKQKRVLKSDVVTEIADVLIMIEQLKIMLNILPSEIEDEKKYKLTRLNARVENEL